MPFGRYIQLVHALPGRLRLRLPWLHDAPTEATPIADGLVGLDGMIEVRLRPYTGGLLCTYDADRLNVTAIIDSVRELSGVDEVLARGERPPRVAYDHSRIAKAAATFFQDVNQDILEASEGRLDLGTLASLTFAGAGAVEVTATGQLPLPPWFNLAWWAIRTFTILETER